MSPKEEAKEIYQVIYGMGPKRESVEMIEQDKILSKKCALYAIDLKIKYHESLFDKGFKDVHIAMSSPIKTYNQILNPLLKHLLEVKKEIEQLNV